MTDSADATASWLYDAVIRYLQGPMYTTPLMGFIDAKCLVFDDEEENKLEFTIIHNEFKALVENLLSDFLVELGVTPEGFVDVVSRANGEKALGEFVASSILTVDDYFQFKAMMVRRNLDLTEEVLEAHGLRDTTPESDAASSVAVAASPGTPERGPESRDETDDDGGVGRLSSRPSARAAPLRHPVASPDTVALQKALRMSSAQFEADERQIDARVEAQIETIRHESVAANERDQLESAALDVATRKAARESERQFAEDLEREAERKRASEVLEAQERARVLESTREVARRAALPELEEEMDEDDGFDAGAVAQALRMSEEQFQKDVEKATALEAAALEKARIKRDAEREMERLADIAVARDIAKAVEASLGAAATEAAALERERLELDRALALSLLVEERATRDLEEAELGSADPTAGDETNGVSARAEKREETHEKAREETLAAQEETLEERAPASETVEADDFQRRTRPAVFVADTLAKTPLGASLPLPSTHKERVGSLPSLAALPPLRAVRGGAGYKSAGYKAPAAANENGLPPDARAASSTVSERNRRAIREAAVAAAAAQKALVLEKQRDLKRRADEAAARAALAAAEAAARASEPDAASLESKRRLVAEQRGLLVARKAAARERELAAFEARAAASRGGLGASALGNGAQSRNEDDSAVNGAIGREASFAAKRSPDGAVSEEAQREKREALRAELARRMKADLAGKVRNAWRERESYV